MNQTLLLVDDDPHLLEARAHTVRQRFQVATATGGEAALALIQTKGPSAATVADMTLPRVNGVELLVKGREHCLDSARTMLTGSAVLRCHRSSDGLACMFHTPVAASRESAAFFRAKGGGALARRRYRVLAVCAECEISGSAACSCAASGRVRLRMKS